MTFKEFFTKLKENGKINTPEFNDLIEKAPEGEFPDKAFEAFESAFLTLDRAAAHPEVNTKLRAELLDPVDRDIHKLIEHDLKEYLDHGKINELKNEKSTYKKVAALAPVLTEAIKKVKAPPSGDEDTKKKLKSLEETRDELLQKIEQINKEYADKEKAISQEWEKKFSDYRLDNELEKMSNGFTLAEGFAETRPAITKVILTDLKSKHALSLGEKDGQPIINVLDESGKPKFNGNAQVTIKDLLEEAWKPFVKKSNPSGAPNTGGNPGGSQETQRFNVENQNQTRQGVRTTVQ